MTDTVGEELVKLAMNNPSIKIIDEQIKAGKLEWGIQKAGWLNNLNASFNLNEGNLRKSISPNDFVGFYPRYNFNLSVPLGNFVTKGKQIKKARSQYDQTIAMKEAEQANIKETVLVVYQNYLMNRYLLALQEATIEDEKTIYEQIEQKFKSNTITLDAFTAASKRLNDALTRKVGLLREVNVSKYQLETLIGMPFEQALATIRNKGRR
jgi:outer membrane protein TolC